MKTIYKCEYCDQQAITREVMENHEKVCVHNPNNGLCDTCTRYTNLFRLNMFDENKGAVINKHICTAIGFVEKKPFGCSCSFYIKDYRIK